MAVEDKVSAEFEAMLRGFELEITVGIHEEEGGESHGEGTTIAEVGSVHEFGLGVPQRSFVRGYFDDNVGQIENDQNDAMQRIVDGADPMQEAERFALKLENGMKQRILARIEPPLAESTKRQRGEGAVPLVDSAQMLGAIRGKVKDNT